MLDNITIHPSDAARNREAVLEPAHFKLIARAESGLIYVAGTGGNFNRPSAPMPRLAPRPNGEHRARAVASHQVR